MAFTAVPVGAIDQTAAQIVALIAAGATADGIYIYKEVGVAASSNGVTAAALKTLVEANSTIHGDFLTAMQLESASVVEFADEVIDQARQVRALVDVNAYNTADRAGAITGRITRNTIVVVEPIKYRTAFNTFWKVLKGTYVGDYIDADEFTNVLPV